MTLPRTIDKPKAIALMSKMVEEAKTSLTLYEKSDGILVILSDLDCAPYSSWKQVERFTNYGD